MKFTSFEFSWLGAIGNRSCTRVRTSAIAIILPSSEVLSILVAVGMRDYEHFGFGSSLKYPFVELEALKYEKIGA